MSQPTQAPPQQEQEKGRRFVSNKHRDVLAYADVCDQLDELDEETRRRVIGWVNDKYLPRRPHSTFLGTIPIPPDLARAMGLAPPPAEPSPAETSNGKTE